MRGLLLAILLTSIATPAVHAAQRVCDQSESRLTPSPDGKWTASVQEEVCSTEAGGAAAGITVVLVPAADAAIRKRVFIMPVPRSRDDWPRIRWPAADTMEIRIPNLAEASPPEPAFEGIRIILTHCEDNPDDRARLAAYRAAVQQWQKDVTAWVQRRDLDPTAAGPRPARPEEPRLPRGRCHD